MQYPTIAQIASNIPPRFVATATGTVIAGSPIVFTAGGSPFIVQVTTQCSVPTGGAEIMALIPLPKAA